MRIYLGVFRVSGDVERASWASSSPAAPSLREGNAFPGLMNVSFQENIADASAPLTEAQRKQPPFVTSVVPQADRVRREQNARTRDARRVRQTAPMDDPFPLHEQSAQTDVRARDDLQGLRCRRRHAGGQVPASAGFGAAAASTSGLDAPCSAAASSGPTNHLVPRDQYGDISRVRGDASPQPARAFSEVGCVANQTKRSAEPGKVALRGIRCAH